MSRRERIKIRTIGALLLNQEFGSANNTYKGGTGYTYFKSTVHIVMLNIGPEQTEAID